MVRASKSTMLQGPGLTVIGPLQAAKVDSSGQRTKNMCYPLFYKLEASDWLLLWFKMCLRLENVVNRFYNFISPPSQASNSHSSSVDSKGHPSKPRYTQVDLPFPHECYMDGQGSDCLNWWQSCFIPSLLSWARAQHNPFGTNCLLVMNNSEEVAKI